jgi:hypothetical protein
MEKNVLSVMLELMSMDFALVVQVENNLINYLDKNFKFNFLICYHLTQ